MAVANSESVAGTARRLFGRARPGANGPQRRRSRSFHAGRAALDLDALCRLPPLAAGGIRVGLIGTFARWKGHDVFLKALAARAVSDVPVRGYVIGAPIYETESSQFSVDELRDAGRERGR